MASHLVTSLSNQTWIYKSPEKEPSQKAETSASYDIKKEKTIPKMRRGTGYFLISGDRILLLLYEYVVSNTESKLRCKSGGTLVSPV